MPNVICICKNCGYKSALTWHDRCPVCNARTSMARCSDCRYSGYFKEFWEKGCPKCAGTSILAVDRMAIFEFNTFEENLHLYSGIGALFVIFYLLFNSIIFIEKSLVGSSSYDFDILFNLWYFWFSVVISILGGVFVGIKLLNRLRIKQKAREIEARDKNMRPIIAGATKVITNPTEINNRKLPIIVMTPSEMSADKKIRFKIKDILSELPIIEHESRPECRQKMINQPGADHPAMYSGSLENTLDFVARMIQETEIFILSCKGIVKVEKAFVISDWPIRKPVFEIQYEQFWDNNTSNVYSEHVMRIGSDEYEVFGSKKSHDRMKAIWKE